MAHRNEPDRLDKPEPLFSFFKEADGEDGSVKGKKSLGARFKWFPQKTFWAVLAITMLITIVAIFIPELASLLNETWVSIGQWVPKQWLSVPEVWKPWIIAAIPVVVLLIFITAWKPKVTGTMLVLIGLGAAVFMVDRWAEVETRKVMKAHQSRVVATSAAPAPADPCRNAEQGVAYYQGGNRARCVVSFRFLENGSLHAEIADDRGRVFTFSGQNCSKGSTWKYHRGPKDHGGIYFCDKKSDGRISGTIWDSETGQKASFAFRKTST